jgi:hypothetical protein
MELIIIGEYLAWWNKTPNNVAQFLFETVTAYILVRALNVSTSWNLIVWSDAGNKYVSTYKYLPYKNADIWKQNIIHWTKLSMINQCVYVCACVCVYV